ncbi:hypothetical protein FIBSPDRAFT_947948 [Athelia psychrophila]|uniref:F-box domain-containing protein n=1 Tax=Athelia psychrophila TaxID=1759441 RepID=A0A166R9A3_9AGAM|nr:hypothetical protein FIBSPDRAFT_947948 [Fibularhizoctonia sp. CBS 109695]
MLDKLPAELQLKVLSFLRLWDLHQVQLISKSWNALFIAHQNPIHRNASYVHGLIPSPNVFLEKAIETSPRGSTDGVIDWKMFVQRKVKMENNWQGREQPSVRVLSSSGSTVHRIKIDENRGLVITTLEHGGVVVNDLDKNEVLWSLPQSHVVDYAHCEYDAGFLVFTGQTGNLEVWRLADDFDDTPGPLESQPEEEQIRASDSAGEQYQSNTSRGHFRAWALMQPPATTRASRFVYPTLIAVGQTQAFLWDIITGRLIITIDNIDGMVDGEPLGRIKYVEFNKNYVVICGSNQLRIFANRPQSTLLYHITSSSQRHVPFSVELAKLVDEQHDNAPNMVPIPLTWRKNNPMAKGAPKSFSDDHYRRALLGNDDFVAAHFSPCGSNLVCMRSTGKILLIKNIERVVRGEMALTNSAVQIDLHPDQKYITATYLAVGVGRIAVATGAGIFVISLNDGDGHFTFQRQPADSIGLLSPFPHIRICQAPCFYKRGLLRELSCLQITATALYVTWAVDDRVAEDRVTLQSMWATAIQNHLVEEEHDGDHGDVFSQDIEAAHSADLHPPLFEDHDDLLPDLQSVDSSDDEGWVGIGGITVVALDFLPV